MPRIVFVIVFFVLTILPGLQIMTGFAPPLTVDENRTLAPAPSSKTPLDKLPRVADRWYADHFGLRSDLIRLKTQIDFSVFGMSDRVLIGRDGQLFYRSTVNVQTPFTNNTLATNEASALRGFRDFSNALNAAGIKLVVMVNMLSDRFYPELLPGDAVRRPSHPRIDDFVAKLRDIPTIDVVDSTAILRMTKAERRIFHKTDFHWNDPAAFPVARAIVDRISAKEGRSKSVWSHALAIEERRSSGGIAMFMPLFFPPSEMSLYVKENWQWPKGFRQSENEGIFESVTKADPDPDLLPPTVFVGDSFLDGMLRSGIHANFIETHRIRWRPDLKASDIAASLPKETRWLVIQFIEVNMTPVLDFSNAVDVSKAIDILAKRQEAHAARP